MVLAAQRYGEVLAQLRHLHSAVKCSRARTSHPRLFGALYLYRLTAGNSSPNRDTRTSARRFNSCAMFSRIGIRGRQGRKLRLRHSDPVRVPRPSSSGSAAPYEVDDQKNDGHDQ
jgi:hypothetical protein